MTNGYEFFKNNNYLKVLVNDKEYDCREGIETDSGFYRNGFTSQLVEGKKGKYDYVKFNLFTSAGGEIQIEEKWLIRSDGKLCKRVGWSNICLMRLAQPGEHEEDIKLLVEKFSERLNL